MVNILCSDCGKCCSHPRIMLSYKEIQKMLSIGFTENQLLVVRPYNNAGSWDSDWENSRVYDINGNKYELCIKRKNGKCIFLTQQGCSLKENRFLICKIYPFWITKNIMDYDKDQDFHCPLNRLSIREGLGIIGETKRSIQKYHYEFMLDTKEHKQDMIDICKNLLNKEE